MAVYTEIDIDFERQKYQKVNAKAGDEATRFLRLTCYNSGVPDPLDASEQEVYMRYKKSDGTNVFTKGIINEQGQAEVELTKQMLAAYGLCYADLLILDKDGYVEEIGGQISVLSTHILSSMLFVVNVQSMAFSDDALESMDDYDDLSAIIELAKLNAEKIEGYLEEAETDAHRAEESAITSKVNEIDAEAWAVGTRDGSPVPDTDITYRNNSKHYSEVADAESKDSEAWANGTRDGVEIQEGDVAYQKNSKYFKGLAEGWAVGGTEDIDRLTEISDETGVDLVNLPFVFNETYPTIESQFGIMSHYDGQTYQNNLFSHLKEDGAFEEYGLFIKGFRGDDSREKADALKKEIIELRQGLYNSLYPDTYHNNAKYYSEVADRESQEAEAWAQGTKKFVPDPAYATMNSKYYSEQSALNGEAWAKGTRGGVVDPERATDNSKYYSEQSSASADVSDNSRKRSEAWAVGQIDGVDVPDTDETYENNAKHWAGYAEDMYNGTIEFEGHAEAWAKGTIEGVPVPSTDPAYHNNSKYWADLARVQVEPFIHGAEVDYTLYASQWFSSSYSLEEDFPYEDYYMWIQPSADATLAQMKAFGNAILSSEDNQNILVAEGIVPTIDIPCKLYLIAKMTP